MQGILGKKLGMSQVVNGKGELVPVTIIEAGPCLVVQRKTKEKNGYDSVQIGFGDCTEKHMIKPLRGQFKNAKKGLDLPYRRHLKEFKVESADASKAGDPVTVGMFEGVTHVDVEGVTKGRGFQGVVKRHNMGGGPMTHGGHSKRRIGSNGQNVTPARVMKGKRMAGHMGNVNVTVQNLEVVAVRGEQNLLLVKGAIPGPNGALLTVRKAIKKPSK
jgi:large subunit ribosomal protein L3